MKPTIQLTATLLVAALLTASLSGQAAPLPKPQGDGPPATAELEDPNEPAEAVDVKVDPERVKAGAELYKSYCKSCHGVEMVTQGGGSFDLRTFPLNDKARFINSVSNGKRSMPAWGAVLKQPELENLWNYIANYQVSKH